jgi:hypothetical protein
MSYVIVEFIVVFDKILNSEFKSLCESWPWPKCWKWLNRPRPKYWSSKWAVKVVMDKFLKTIYINLKNKTGCKKGQDLKKQLDCKKAKAQREKGCGPGKIEKN